MEIQSTETEKRLSTSFFDLEYMGYRMEKSPGQLIVNGVPAILGEKGLSILAESLSEDSDFNAEADGQFGAVAASIACKAAIKDGDLLEDSAAIALIAQSLALPLPDALTGGLSG